MSERGVGASLEGNILMNWGFPKIRGTSLGGPYNKDYKYIGVYILWSPYFGILAN